MKNLLLEIGVEPLPVESSSFLLNELVISMENLLKEMEVEYRRGCSLGTNRRLTLFLEEVNEYTPSKEKEILGPPWASSFTPDGKPLSPALGFAKKFGVSWRNLRKVRKGKGEYVAVVIKEEGKPVKYILKEEIPRIILSIKLPQSMFWGKRDMPFLRPVRWVMCLWGEETISFSLNGIISDRFSYGHFLLSPEKVKLEKASLPEYLNTLRDHFVICDPEEREKIINQGIKKNLHKNEEIEEIGEIIRKSIWSIEHPCVMRGNFPEKFLSLPSEILIASMVEHQLYIPVKKGKSLINSFIVIGEGEEVNRKTMIKGHERVLVARLCDAEFFFKEDQKIPLRERVENLSSLTFHERLGNLYEKTKRIIKLTERATDILNISEEWREIALRAAYLCKADLLTGMVNEFPSLQGIMGGKYSLLQGERKEVALAIEDHYFPFSPWRKKLPRNIAGKIISLVDKLDTICSYASLDSLPTGSYDPFGLRRQALGVISIILGKEEKKINVEQGLRIPLRKLLSNSSLWGRKEITEEVINFIYNRFRGLLLEEGLRYDIVESVLVTGGESLQDVYLKAKALEKLQKEGRFSEIMTPYRRIANILKQAEERFTSTGIGEVQEDLITDKEERTLWDRVKEMEKDIYRYLEGREYSQVLHCLIGLKPLVDRYFDNVLVMEEDSSRRRNHLSILNRLHRMFSPFVDFSLLKGE